jgi:hypothetical protein
MIPRYCSMLLDTFMICKTLATLIISYMTLHQFCCFNVNVKIFLYHFYNLCSNIFFKNERITDIDSEFYNFSTKCCKTSAILCPYICNAN